MFLVILLGAKIRKVKSKTKNLLFFFHYPVTFFLFLRIFAPTLRR